MTLIYWVEILINCESDFFGRYAYGMPFPKDEICKGNLRLSDVDYFCLWDGRGSKASDALHMS